MPPILLVAAVCGAVFVAATLSWLAGFGFALLVVPVLAVTVGAAEAVAVTSVLSTVTSVALAIRLRRAVQWSIAWRQLAAVAFGMPIGLVALVTFDERTLRLCIAVGTATGTLALLRGARTTHARATSAADVGAGFVAGLLTTSVGTPGPPLVLANQARGLSPLPFRATLSAVFALSTVAKLGLFAGADQLNGPVLLFSTIALPSLAGGWWLATRLQARLDPARFRTLVIGLLFLSSAAAGVAALTG